MEPFSLIQMVRLYSLVEIPPSDCPGLEDEPVEASEVEGELGPAETGDLTATGTWIPTWTARECVAAAD